MSSERMDIQRSLRRHLLAGLSAIVVLVAGFGSWSAMTEISGAVVTSGILVVDSSVKKVQHPTGGIVGELFVRDGDHVKAGDLVLRLDDTVAKANLAIILKTLDELAVRQARLEAERDDLDDVSFPQDLIKRAGNPDVARTINGEKRLFDLRRTARQGQKGQLRERIGQLREEIRGVTGQAEAKERELKLINKELEAVRELWRQNLVPISRVTSVERDAVRIDGERNQLIASMAQTRGKITETELQIIQVDQDLRSEVAKELREIQSKNAEQVERKVTAEDLLKRIDIRAPQDGVVTQLSVHTIGGVVNAGDILMLVVPEADKLTVEAKLPPQNIDQVQVGKVASLRFSAFNSRTTPEISGRVTLVSADIAQDQKSGASYYTVRIALSPDEIERLNGLKLVPGMPVEAFVQSDNRTVISYLVKPLRDQIEKAFRER